MYFTGCLHGNALSTMSSWPVLFTVGNLLSVVSASAPGDSDSLCLQPNLYVPLPPTVRVLMDTFHYNTLLSDDNESLWQQVDLDRNSTRASVSISFILTCACMHAWSHPNCSGTNLLQTYSVDHLYMYVTITRVLRTTG
jgi:hypothetical protein